MDRIASPTRRHSSSTTVAPTPWLTVVLIWALTAGLYALKAALSTASTPLILDTDDAMRLTDVHDVLAGQGWFDLIQHRLNTPWGGSIHWSRLVDLPEAALVGALRLVVSPERADIAAAYAWPLLLLLPMFWLTGRIASLLGGRQAVGLSLLISAASLATLGEFSPGRFDHHSVQIILTLAMVLCTLQSLGRPRFAVGAGFAAAAALAIGVEGLPIVAATVLAFGLLGALDARHATAMRDFGLSFATATVFFTAIGVPPPQWLVPSIDAISIVYATGAILCGVAFTALSLLPVEHRLFRFVIGAVAGVFVLLAVVALFPQTLRGPYAAVDPWLQSHWLNRISEAESWFTSFRSDPVYPAAAAVPVILALVAAGQRAVDPARDRALWRVVFLFLAVSVVIMAIQIRAVRIACPLAVPVTAALVSDLWARMKGRLTLWPMIRLSAAGLASMGIVVAVMAALLTALVPGLPDGSGDAERAGRNACYQPQAFADLKQLPAQRLMTPIDLGSHTLLFTSHSVVAAPYHRNGVAVLDAFRFFSGPIDKAREILTRRGITLVVICPALPEIRRGTEPAANSFVKLYAQGKLPTWLTKESTDGSTLEIYRVSGT